jgi:hypothetical protein
MLWRVHNSRGRPSNAPTAFIHPCQPIVAIKEEDCGKGVDDCANPQAQCDATHGSIVTAVMIIAQYRSGRERWLTR